MRSATAGNNERAAVQPLPRGREAAGRSVRVFLEGHQSAKAESLAGPAAHARRRIAPLARYELSSRTALWTAAIDKAKSMWGENWGVAYNGEKVRTQCHTHVHIGRLMPHIENDKFIVISNPSQIPAPPGEGLWIHPAGKKMHVHLGEQTTETTLMR